MQGSGQGGSSPAAAPLQDVSTVFNDAVELCHTLAVDLHAELEVAQSILDALYVIWSWLTPLLEFAIMICALLIPLLRSWDTPTSATAALGVSISALKAIAAVTSSAAMTDIMADANKTISSVESTLGESISILTDIKNVGLAAELDLPRVEHDLLCAKAECAMTVRSISRFKCGGGCCGSTAGSASASKHISTSTSTSGKVSGPVAKSTLTKLMSEVNEAVELASTVSTLARGMLFVMNVLVISAGAVIAISNALYLPNQVPASLASLIVLLSVIEKSSYFSYTSASFHAALSDSVDIRKALQAIHDQPTVLQHDFSDIRMQGKALLRALNLPMWHNGCCCCRRAQMQKDHGTQHVKRALE